MCIFALLLAINSFNELSKRQAVQLFLIDEIDATKSIENIESTRHDIYSLINNYFNKIVEILIDCLDKSINKLKDKVNKLKALSIPKTFSKLEQRIYSFIYESLLFTDFGVNSSDIMNNTNSSKRTIIYTLNKFNKK